MNLYAARGYVSRHHEQYVPSGLQRRYLIEIKELVIQHLKVTLFAVQFNMWAAEHLVSIHAGDEQLLNLQASRVPVACIASIPTEIDVASEHRNLTEVSLILAVCLLYERDATSSWESKKHCLKAEY